MRAEVELCRALPSRTLVRNTKNTDERSDNQDDLHPPGPAGADLLACA